MIRFGKNAMGRVVRGGEPISFQPKVYAKPRNTVAPVITGTPAVGEVLTYVAGSWVDFSSINFTWFANGQFVQFSGPTYTVLPADAGKTITVLEQATNPSGGASARSAGKVIP